MSISGDAWPSYGVTSRSNPVATSNTNPRSDVCRVTKGLA